jgi:hypothetical protein
LLLGIGFFFPAFVFSIPFTMIWASYEWPGDGQASLGAMVVSFCIGIVGAVICCIVLVKRHLHRTR